MEYARRMLLWYTRCLAEMEYENVSVILDLTITQRQEELVMRDKAKSINEEELTDDDLAKKLVLKSCRPEMRELSRASTEKQEQQQDMEDIKRDKRGAPSKRNARNARSGNKGGRERKQTRNNTDHEQQPLRKQLWQQGNRTTIRAKHKAETEQKFKWCKRCLQHFRPAVGGRN